MNDDYRVLHGLCRLFLGNRALEENAGVCRFRGFILDMNVLFETFVTEAFSVVARGTPLTVFPQKPETFANSPFNRIMFRPDVVIRDGPLAVAIVDAKYKRLDDAPANPDFYQMLAYGTVLRCSKAYLLYPGLGLDEDVIEVRNSAVKIFVRQIDIASPDCVSLC
jgi:5-methylcytosine-specific restriction enzyme subunit McrC